MKKIPAWSNSTRNRVLSFTLAWTLTCRTISYVSVATVVWEFFKFSLISGSICSVANEAGVFGAS